MQTQLWTARSLIARLPEGQDVHRLQSSRIWDEAVGERG